MMKYVNVVILLTAVLSMDAAAAPMESLGISLSQEPPKREIEAHAKEYTRAGQSVRGNKNEFKEKKPIGKTSSGDQSADTEKLQKYRLEQRPCLVCPYILKYEIWPEPEKSGSVSAGFSSESSGLSGDFLSRPRKTKAKKKKKKAKSSGRTKAWKIRGKKKT